MPATTTKPTPCLFDVAVHAASVICGVQARPVKVAFVEHNCCVEIVGRFTCVGRGTCNTDTDPFDGVFSGCSCNPGYRGYHCQYVACPTSMSLVGGTCRSFNIATTNERTRTGPQFVDPSVTTFYTVGESYRIAPKRLFVNETSTSSGTVADITYSLDNMVDGFFVNTKTGEMFLRFTKAGVYATALIAMDKSGLRVTVEKIIFIVNDKANFGLSPKYSQSHTVKSNTQSKYTSFESLSIPGLEMRVDEMYVNVAKPVTYSVHVEKRDQNQNGAVAGSTSGSALSSLAHSARRRRDHAVSTIKFFVSDNAEILGVPKVTGNFTAFLMARDQSGVSVSVRIWDFAVLEKDTEISENGPKGAGCLHGRVIDVVKLDGKFTCDCNSTLFVGENCQDLANDDSSETNEVSGVRRAYLQTIRILCPSVLMHP